MPDAPPSRPVTRRRARPWPAMMAILLALTTLAVGLGWATTVASGADAHGYISQADGWLAGTLTIDQSWAADAPWPMARWTLTPLGYRPSSVDGRPWDLVPSYPPGFPLLLAIAKRLGGQEALFGIVPLAGALLVLATFGIARHLIGAWPGVAAAWLLATSPTVLFMGMLPMSDVPAAAAWALAFWALLGEGRKRMAVAGACAGLAITIRPNLAPLAAALAIWAVAARRRERSGVRAAAAFLPGVVGGVLVVAGVNTVLNGAPWVSGYGSLDGAFAWSYVWPNSVAYSTWLMETQTPLALAGLAAALIPVPPLWPAGRVPGARAAMAGTVAIVWVSYLVYRPYDAWWFLRFLLPSWPFVTIGTVALLAAVVARRPATRGVVALAVIALGGWQIAVAIDRGAFRLWQDERRAVSAARAVAATTPTSAVIFSRQHSGSVRYYAGRLTARFEEFEPGDVDRAVTWFAAQGRPSYLLIDEAERALARDVLAGQQALARLSDPPVFQYSGATEVYLYRLDQPHDRTLPTQSLRDTWAHTRSVEPANDTIAITPAR